MFNISAFLFNILVDTWDHHPACGCGACCAFSSWSWDLHEEIEDANNGYDEGKYGPGCD